jgi:hypothetical protein
VEVGIDGLDVPEPGDLGAFALAHGLVAEVPGEVPHEFDDTPLSVMGIFAFDPDQGGQHLVDLGVGNPVNPLPVDWTVGGAQPVAIAIPTSSVLCEVGEVAGGAKFDGMGDVRVGSGLPVRAYVASESGAANVSRAF